MDTPGCSKVSSSESAEFDLPDLQPPSITKNESPDQTQTEDKSESVNERHQRPTECAICTKPANGYHYDVRSCNGCKTFFRRMCISDKNFQCKAKGDCFDLTKRDTPIKCRACRYDKCITAGMNPMAMQVDEKEATAGNFKKLTKRVKRSSSQDDDDDDDDIQEIPVAQKQIVKAITNFENRIQNLVDNLNYLEGKVAKLRMSAYNPHWKTFPGLEGFLTMANKINLADSAGVGHMDERSFYGFVLSADARMAFENFSSSSENKFFEARKRDRLILMKHSALALMNLHISYFTVARKYDSVVHPDGTLAPMKVGMVYERTVMSISPLIRCDIQETEYVLLKAICLCNPAVPDLSDHAIKILTTERGLFAEALFDHCLRNRRDGPSQFAEIVGIVDLLERQQRMQKDLHLLHVAPFVSRIPKEDKMLLIEDIMNS
uniref:Nuclear receptor n=1 Tax=Caenorhabditis tropicalis TaxID=1561998 RepID=A0A1I7UVN0_9PELO